MTTTTIPQPVNFDRADLNAAINAALASTTDARLIRAINRAATNLATGRFSYDGHQVILQSASSKRMYRISTTEPMQCTCEGRAHGQICWHIVAARLLVRAAERRAALVRAAEAVAVAYRPRPRVADGDPNWPARAICPMCGAEITVRQYHIGGKGFQFFEVCSGDGSHYAQAA